MFERFMTDAQVEKRYINTGNIFGDAVSYLYMGECVGFERMLARWEKWETEYARRGYRTLPLDTFIDCGGYGVPLRGIGVKREEGEAPVFHAKIYRGQYLGKMQPAIDPSKPEVQEGTYTLPSTKDK